MPDNLPSPLALRYHGHQFQSYNPNLGDGRGFLFAQMKASAQGSPLALRQKAMEEKKPKTASGKADELVLDLGTKGSGQTPYSRGGDGRLTLKGAVREILATEWLEALGVNTSKTFSVIETGEALIRHDEPSPTRGAVLVRLSHSHIRFGTFQRLAYFEKWKEMETLIEHCIQYYFQELAGEEFLVKSLFRAVVENSARLCAQWMNAGFVHGVLNTDNLVITGESFDYGPYRWLPYYDPLFTAAYFDHSGLYAYGRQPAAVAWNLYQLQQCFTPLIKDPAGLDAELESFGEIFSKEFVKLFIGRLNLVSKGFKEDQQLMITAFAFMQKSRLPFDEFFFDWMSGIESQNRALASPRKEFYKGEAFESFKKNLSSFEPQQNSKTANLIKSFEHPIHMRIEEVERIWSLIDQEDDWSGLYQKVEAIQAWGQILSDQ